MLNLFLDNYVYILVSFCLGLLLSYVYFLVRDKWFVSTVKKQAQELIDQAKQERERIEKESKIQLKEQMFKTKIELEKESKEKRKDLSAWEKRLLNKEDNLEKKVGLVDAKEEKLKRQEQSIVDKDKRLSSEIDTFKSKVSEMQRKLENLTGLTTEEAKKIQVEMILNEAKHDSARNLQRIEKELKEESDKKAKSIISTAVQRYSGEYIVEKTISSVTLPNDEMKGRIIGREGRNIRAIEAATGVDLIIDDTPETVIISGFDPIKREVARLSIERLIADGRIHPGRIEEIVEKVRGELDREIKEAGERAMFDVGVHGINPEILKLIGSLKYRTSYSQNQYIHSLEVSFLCGVIAGEIGIDQKKAKRAGLLHDIGKAVDHNVEGSHAKIGADLAKKYGEAPDIIHSIMAHHEEVKSETELAIIVQAADALSSARPGARREMLESYIKRVEDLENIANSFDGVDKAFAIQAGREVRVMVNSENISDEDAVVLSRDIAKKIEDELSYPGQVKVTVIRETRAVGMAK